MKRISSISGIISDYDIFFLDLWGVIHDGTHLYPKIYESLVELKKLNKEVIFISNAPRRAINVINVLHNLGIDESLYKEVVSSGEVGFRWLKNGYSNWGKRYYLISALKDVATLDGLDFDRVDKLQEANFILNLGFGSEEQTTEDYHNILKEAANLSLPMLCLNPDLEVVKINGDRFPCAGAIAKEYINFGGEVKWFGKPYIDIYNYCHDLLGRPDKNKILAVGDSLETDIPGAKNFDIDSVLVTGGILKNKSIEEINNECKKLNLTPKYITSGFGFTS
ncbi:MAG: TIGR01459 family HAD-type hydrolase [Rickettsiales bacterium]